MTRRLRRYIARQSLLPRISFSDLAKETGISERTIRNVFKKHITHLNNIRKIETPCVMGMDGVYVKRQEALIVTDLERGRIVLMRPSIKERAVAAALREMPNLDKVEEVLADMAGGLDRVQKEVIPKAIRTKDRYHVQRLANTAVDKIRRAVTPSKQGRKKGQRVMGRSHIFRKRRFQLKDHEKATLDWCLGLYPELRLTYELKEVYCEFWNSPDGATARLKYAEWLKLHKAWKKEMPEDLRGAFAPLIRLMKNGEEGIFNYFHARHTNARTESANARVKRYTNNAPRANFDTVNAKMVHGTRLEQQHKAVRRKGKRRQEPQHIKKPIPPPVVDSACAVLESPQENQRLTPPSMIDSLVADAKQQGPRLDVSRIATLKCSAEDEDNAVSSSSPQMLLFE
jgi:transposase